MGEKEAKKREAAMFVKNTILINRTDKLEEALDHAKMIIRKLLKIEEEHMYFFCDGSEKDEYIKLRKEAEQILKEDA